MLTSHCDREENQRIPLNVVGDHILNRLDVVRIFTLTDVRYDT